MIINKDDGFSIVSGDGCLLSNTTPIELLHYCLSIDYLLVTSPDANLIAEFRELLATNYKLKDLGTPHSI